MILPIKTLLILALFIALIPKLSLANDVEYALDIRASNSEFGNIIPKELCQDEKKSPCRLPIFLLHDIVPKIKSTQKNLSAAAYSALKRNAKKAQVVWEFNLCKPRWDKKID